MEERREKKKRKKEEATQEEEERERETRGLLGPSPPDSEGTELDSCCAAAFSSCISFAEEFFALLFRNFFVVSLHVLAEHPLSSKQEEWSCPFAFLSLLVSCLAVFLSSQPLHPFPFSSHVQSSGGSSSQTVRRGVGVSFPPLLLLCRAFLDSMPVQEAARR